MSERIITADAVAAALRDALRYKAASLDDIAAFFTKRSEECKARAEHSVLQRGRRELMAEACVWEEAAGILRRTTIKG